MSLTWDSRLNETLVVRLIEAARFALETEIAELGGFLKKIDDQIHSCLGIHLACRDGLWLLVLESLGIPVISMLGRHRQSQHHHRLSAQL